jgi:hypothetical protein
LLNSLSSACRTHSGQYYEVVAHLVAAGARVTPDVIEWDKAQLDPEMLTALRGRP